MVLSGLAQSALRAIAPIVCFTRPAENRAHVEESHSADALRRKQPEGRRGDPHACATSTIQQEKLIAGMFTTIASLWSRRRPGQDSGCRNRLTLMGMLSARSVRQPRWLAGIGVAVLMAGLVHGTADAQIVLIRPRISRWYRPRLRRRFLPAPV